MLDRLLAAHGLTQAQAAKAAELSQGTVSNALNGRRVRPSTLKLLLQALDADAADEEHALALLAGMDRDRDREADAGACDAPDELIRTRVAALLRVVVELLEARRPRRGVHYRVLVTTRLPKWSHRDTFCYASILNPPEGFIPVPWDFGVAGEVYKDGVFHCEDFEPGIAHLDRDGKPVTGISTDLRCVAAWPLRTSNGWVFGTLNADSNATLAQSKLGTLEVQAALQLVVELSQREMCGLAWVRRGST
jgi:transcriptional regulator with XRE-family HTH domain